MESKNYFYGGSTIDLWFQEKQNNLHTWEVITKAREFEGGEDPGNACVEGGKAGAANLL